MDIYSTGNPIVDAIGKLNITGNIIPESWYKTIVKPNTGKPNLRAMMFLSEIIYWYRPSEIRDEITGHTIGWKKKMYADMLQRSYADWADKFGCSKGEATTTIDELVELGVVIKELRTIVHNGMRISNVLYLGLNVNRLIELTYPSQMQVVCNNQSKDKKQIAIAKKSDRVSDKKQTPLIKKADTNTENTQENTLTIHSFVQESERRDDDKVKTLVEEVLISCAKIPYSYKEDERKMRFAIYHISDWYSYREAFEDKLKQKTFNLAVDALIEMSCDSKIRIYNGRHVSYANVIDKINENIKEHSYENIYFILEQAVEEFIKASSKAEIKHPRNYIKSCIWDCFDTCDIRFGSLYNRTYNKDYATMGKTI